MVSHKHRIKKGVPSPPNARSERDRAMYHQTEAMPAAADPVTSRWKEKLFQGWLFDGYRSRDDRLVDRL
jgi:hypothetical protein